MKTLTKMSSSSVRDGTVVHRSSNASSLYSNIDTEKFPSSVFRVIVLQREKFSFSFQRDISQFQAVFISLTKTKTNILYYHICRYDEEMAHSN